MYIRRTPTQTDRNFFADLLRHCREDLKLSQEQLSICLGCSAHWISDIEQGKCNPNWRDVLHLAAIVRLDPAVFAEKAGLSVTVPTR